ncbi:hypothetical protein [Vibrio paucivorans]|uniref:Uncharacterized protein n=1 Tax=Vibrio paucivorans TaxID=2829489 RepID=A0A9X3CDX6_9VIBR|nr:hypothetical protein [Vibrio paucivorans]MCW8333966.1 hypothetical protein [Vibrio paucivorans]
MQLDIEPEVQKLLQGIADRSDYTLEQVSEMILNQFYLDHQEGDNTQKPKRP